jgi:predicted enzyme related to lactoylglutathione lyase
VVFQQNCSTKVGQAVPDGPPNGIYKQNMPQPLCNLVVIRSRDLDLASRFYSALGLSFVRHSHGSGPEHLASESQGQVFEVYPQADDTPSTLGVRIGFSVSSVDETFNAILAAGGASVSSPRDSPWGRRAVVSDPDGHRVELTMPVVEEQVVGGVSGTA